MQDAITGAEHAYKDRAFVVTQHGIFWLFDPKFDIRDVAHALSHLCRFNGHINQFYSVAQHSLNVMRLMRYLDPQNDGLEGLLHDATEAYMSDMPAPFKHALPDWSAIDKMLESAMRQQFGLPETKSQLCAEADWLALFIEAYTLLPGQGENFTDPFGLRDKALRLVETNRRAFWPRIEATSMVKAEFIQTYNLLAKR